MTCTLQLTEHLTVWELWYFKAVTSYRGKRFHVPTRQTSEYKVDLTRHPKFPLAFGELSSGRFPHCLWCNKTMFSEINIQYVEAAFGAQALVSFKKYMPPSSFLLQGKHLPFTPSPLRLNIFRLFVILSLTQLYRYTPEIFLFSTATFKVIWNEFLVK